MRQTERARSFDDMVAGLSDPQRRELLLSFLRHDPHSDLEVFVPGTDGGAAGRERRVALNRSTHRNWPIAGPTTGTGRPTQ